jgi:hypothetical protein
VGIFKRLSPRTESPEEYRLLACLKRLSDALYPIFAHGADSLARCRDEAASAFASGSPIARRYEIVRRIETFYHGMGGMRDTSMPKECEDLREDLYRAVQDLLRVYWRQLGREHYSETISPWPVGATVRLVAGKVRYYQRDGSPVVVKDRPGVVRQRWRIVNYDGPDITNMLLYLLQRGDKIMIARHCSLSPIVE